MNEMWESQKLDCHTYLGIKTLRQALEEKNIPYLERGLITARVGAILFQPSISTTEYAEVSELLAQNGIIIGEARPKKLISDNELESILSSLLKEDKVEVIKLLENDYTLSEIKLLESSNPHLGFILVKRIES